MCLTLGDHVSVQTGVTMVDGLYQGPSAATLGVHPCCHSLSCEAETIRHEPACAQPWPAFCTSLDRRHARSAQTS